MDNVKTTLHKLEYNISMYRNHRYHTRCLLQWLRSYFVKNRCAWFRWMSSTPFSHMCTCPVWTARHVHMKIRFVKLSENAHYVHSKPVAQDAIFRARLVKKSLNYLAKLVPNHSSPDAMGSCAKTIGCHPPILVSADSMPTSSTYEALKNCLMFASKPPLAYLCVCYCLSWSSAAALFRHFRNLPVNTSNVPK